MKIATATGGIAHTNCYLVADEASRQCVLFDAPDHTVSPLLDLVEQQNWNLLGLWCTHGHFDHVADHAVVTTRFPNAKLLLHELDESKLEHPISRFLPIPLNIPSRKADGYLLDGQELAIGSIAVKVIYTPGHAPGHVMFHLPEHKVLIGGDLIIMGAVGRTDFPDCSETALFASIRRIIQLPPETLLLPGHGDPSTLEEEQQNNPYVREALGE